MCSLVGRGVAMDPLVPLSMFASPTSHIVTAVAFAVGPLLSHSFHRPSVSWPGRGGAAVATFPSSIMWYMQGVGSRHLGAG